MGSTRTAAAACKPGAAGGRYTYSQGLEWAVESGTVRDEAGALRWIGDQFEWNLGRYEAPLFLRMLEAWKFRRTQSAGPTIRRENLMPSTWRPARLRNCGTAELRAETLQMGYSMKHLLQELGRRLPEIVASALQFTDAEYSNFAPGFAIAYCKHETQYTR